MKKHLLATAFACLAFTSSFAFVNDEYVETSKQAFLVKNATNLFAAGSFSQADLSDWTSTNSEAAITTNLQFVGKDELKENFNDIKFTSNSANGLYASVKVSSGKSYVVSLKMRNFTSSVTTSTSTTIAAAANNAFAIFNTDGTLAGTDGLVNFSTATTLTGGQDWSTIYWALPAQSVDGYITICFAGLTADTEIADIQVAAAEQCFDRRIAKRAINYTKNLLGTYDWTKVDEEAAGDYTGQLEVVQEFADGKATGDGAAEVENLYLFADALVKKTEDFLDLCSTNTKWWTYTGGGASAGGYQKQSGMGDWVMGSARGFLRNHTDDTAYYIGSFGGSGQLDSVYVGYLNRDLAAGHWMASFGAIQYFQTTTSSSDYTRNVDIKGGKARIYVSDGTKEYATSEWTNLDTEDYYRMAINFDVTDEMAAAGAKIYFDLKLLPAYWTYAHGGSFALDSALVQKVKQEGALSEHEKVYLTSVQTQLDALKSTIASATESYNNANMPWGKAALKADIDEAQNRYDAFAGMTQAQILETYANKYVEAKYTNGSDVTKAIANAALAGNTVADTTYSYTTSPLPSLIMNAGVYLLTKYAVPAYASINKPLTDLATALADANTTYADPTYESYDIDTYKKAIDLAQALYDKDFAAADSTSAINAELAQAVLDLQAAKETMKNSLTAETILDVDFSKTAVATETDGVTTYSIPGTKGSVDFASGVFNVWDQSSGAEAWNSSITYCQGWYGTPKNGTLDYYLPDMLHVGKGDAIATIADADMPKRGEIGASKSDVVTITFDYYFGYLMKYYAGFNLLDANGTRIGGFYRGASETTSEYDDFGGLKANTTAKGSSAQYGSGIVAADNKHSFEITLNYGDNSMKASVTLNGTTVSSESVPMLSTNPLKQFVITSNYVNGDRRCWFDNLKISVTRNAAKTTESVTGIESVSANANAVKAVKSIENGQIVITKAGKKFSAAGAQLK